MRLCCSSVAIPGKGGSGVEFLPIALASGAVFPCLQRKLRLDHELHHSKITNENAIIGNKELNGVFFVFKTQLMLLVHVCGQST